MSDGKSIVKREDAQDIQVLDVNRVKDAMEMFNRFKREILTDPGDYWEDKKNQNRRHVRKPGWEKYAMSLNISTDFSEERSEIIKFKGQEILVFHFRGRALAGNGRYAERAGSASSDEGRPWCNTIHGIRAMAQTRAVLRAISALVGGGELTAEEMDTRDVVDAKPEYRKAADMSSQVRRESANVVTDVKPNIEMGDAPAEAADLGQEDAASGIRDVLKAAKLDPEGVEIRSVDWGLFEVIPSKDVRGEKWGDYNKALKPIGAEYHKAGSPQYAGNWTIKTNPESPVER